MPNNPQGPTKQIINMTINRFFNSNSSPDKKTYQNFKDWFNKPNGFQEDLENIDRYNDSSVYAAATRMTGRAEYDAVFDHNDNGFVSDDMIRRIFKPNKVSVITTGHLRGQVQNLVVQAVSSYVVENKISSDADSPFIKGTPLVLALDEAHEYVSHPETSREKIIVDKFRRAARRGRKDKFGLYFITQNPADIDGEVRNQINTKIYMQLDQRVVNDPDVYVPKKYSSSIPQFNKGQMVVKQPDIRPVEIMGLDTCLTRHSK
jgi:DNA helicase HerA-like ATPase